MSILNDIHDADVELQLMMMKNEDIVNHIRKLDRYVDIRLGLCRPHMRAAQACVGVYNKNDDDKTPHRQERFQPKNP